MFITIKNKYKITSYKMFHLHQMYFINDCINEQKIHQVKLIKKIIKI